MAVAARVQQEDGAVAILVSLLMLFVLFPAMALGYGSYIRSGAAAELSRSADSGSLAGAASIPLGDLSFLQSYLAGQGGTIPLPGGGADPLDVACQQAATAAADDSAFAHDWASGAPSCSASYTADLDLLERFGSCISSVGTLGVPTDPEVAAVAAGLRDLLPALLHPGVEVTLTHQVKGPFDELAGRTSTDSQTGEAIARRHFKNLVVLPAVTPPLAGQPLPLNALAASSGADAIAALEALDNDPVIGPILAAQGCDGIFAAAADDFADIVDPPADADAPTPDQIARDAASESTPLLVLVLPADPTGPLQVPFFDFVPVCVEQSATGDLIGHLDGFASCAPGTPGSFRAELES
jgi:hypothetical protein